MKPVKFKSVIVPLIFLAILIVPIGIALGTNDLIGSFTGASVPSCDTCHGPYPTSNFANVTVNSTSGTTIEAGSVITVEIQVLNFTEASSQTITIGFPLSMGDNIAFSSWNPTHDNTVGLDLTGNSTIVTFQVTTPSTAGDFVLVAAAVWDSGALTWASGNVTLTLTPPSRPPINPAAVLVLVIGAAIGGIAAVAAVVLVIKRPQ